VQTHLSPPLEPVPHQEYWPALSSAAGIRRWAISTPLLPTDLILPSPLPAASSHHHPQCQNTSIAAAGVSTSSIVSASTSGTAISACPPAPSLLVSVPQAPPAVPQAPSFVGACTSSNVIVGASITVMPSVNAGSLSSFF